MKRIIFFLLLLFSLSAGAQITTQYLGAPLTLIHQRGLQRNDSALFLPSDTVMRSSWPKSLPAVAAKNGLLYYWSTTLQKWVPTGATYTAGYGTTLNNNAFSVDTFGMATRARLYKVIDSVGSKNIYNSDGTLTDYRTLNLGGNVLSIEGNGGDFYHRYDPTLNQMVQESYTTAHGGRRTSLYQDDQALQLFAEDSMSSGSPIQSQINLLINQTMEFENTRGLYRFSQLRSAPYVAGTSATLMVDAEGYIYKGAAAGTSLTDGDKGDITVSGSGSTWTVDKATVSTLTDGATVTWDYSTQGGEAKVTLAGNRTLSITNLPSGKVVYLTLNVTQDATGSRTLTLPASTKVVNGGAGAVTLTTTGSATDLLVFRWNGTTLYCVSGKNFN